MRHFFAYVSRMKLIQRWGLMRNTLPENDMEHALQTALIAHGLAVYAAARFGKQVSPEHVMALAVYHDVPEVLTGDLPTPVKHHNPQLKAEYRRLERLAAGKLLQMLPKDMRPAYEAYFIPKEDEYGWRLVKAADKICAYIKCLEEQKAGNLEFETARLTLLEAIRAIPLTEVQAFFQEFIPSFSLNLDELSIPDKEESER